jgi:hypothetical protein
MTLLPKQYGSAEGPLGFPMLDKQAFALESILKALPTEDRVLVRAVTARSPSELLDGERADVSWITTECVDRDHEIVVARGMNDSHFKANPLVTLMHNYRQPPVGRSLWRKRVRDGDIVGIKAKTQYPPRPDDWPADPGWPPDAVFALIKAGLLQGKSIGFLRLKSHPPSSHEVAAKPELAQVTRIIDEWLLLEYCVTFLPTNQEALVEAVSKGAVSVPDTLRETLGLKDLPPAPLGPLPGCPEAIPFVSLQEIERHVERIVKHTDWDRLARRLAQEGLDRAQGRI